MSTQHEKRLRASVEALEEARVERDKEIRRAAKAGLSRRVVARVTGLSPSRVQQIVAGVLLAAALLAPAQVSAHKQTLAGEVLSSVQVLRADCPYRDDVLACADSPNRIIYAPRMDARRITLTHEAGHVFDYWNLDDGERGQIEAMYGWSDWHLEGFANAFAACSLNREERRVGQHANLPIDHRHPAMCTFLRGAA